MEYWALGTAGAAVIGLIMAFVYARMVTREPEGDEKMKSIAAAIREGAMAFIKREYRVLAIFVAIVFAIIAIFLWYQPAGGGESTYIGIYTALACLFGAACSMSAGFVGMNIATKANVRTTHAAERGTEDALLIAFRGGSVMGLTVAGLGLLGLSLVYMIFVVWTDIIADLVLPHLRKLHTPALENRMVLAREHIVHHPPRGYLQPPNLFKYFLRNHLIFFVSDS